MNDDHPVAVLIHRGGRVLGGNRAAARLLRHADAALSEGEDLDDLIPVGAELLRADLPHPVAVRVAPDRAASALSVPLGPEGDPRAIRTYLWPREEELHDAATGLPGQTLFLDRIGQALDRSRVRERTRCAVLRIVLRASAGEVEAGAPPEDDGGLPEGVVLQAVQRTAAALRPAETLARLEARELGLLLEDVADVGQAVRTARAVLAELEPPFRHGDGSVSLAPVVGIVLGGEGDRSAAGLLEQARIAARRAARRGRSSGWGLFDESLHAEALSQVELERALRRAVERWQLDLHYQPLVGLPSRDVVGFEALVRWNHPERELVLPGDFLPLAEEVGLMGPLGDRILEEAVGRIAAWSDRPGGGPFVTVNLSRRQLEDPDLAAEVESAIERHGVRPDRLCLEIAETVALDLPDEVFRSLNAVRDLGVRFSLDDFGNGPTSMSLFHRFPFDEVKIDRWLIGRLGPDGGADALVEGILSMCRRRNALPVAEGVETEEQERRLRELGCTRAQGYLYARPMDSERASDLLRGGRLS